MEIMASVDKNSDGRVDIDEFIDWMFQDE